MIFDVDRGASRCTDQLKAQVAGHGDDTASTPLWLQVERFEGLTRVGDDGADTLLASGEKTCIDCHKGIAHHLPEGMTEEDED